MVKNILENSKKTAIMRTMARVALHAFSVLGALFFLLLFVLWVFLRSEAKLPSVPKSAIVLLDLDKAYGEVSQDSLLADFKEGNSVSFPRLLMALDVLSQDERVKAVAAKISVSDLGMAQMQELYQAVHKLHDKGKPTYIFSSGFGVYGGGTKEYYLATAFDKITMQPNTEVGLTGLGVQVPFLRELLDKIGVAPEFFTRYEFKSAMSSFTDKEMSEPFSQSLRGLLASLNFEFLKGIMVKRYQDVDIKQIYGMMDNAPFSAEYAKDKGLIDEIAYESDWLSALEEKYDAERVNFDIYAETLVFKDESPLIAVVSLEGVISEGLSMDNSLQGDMIVGAQTVLKQLREIEKNQDVKAVVVRINSPGGSYNASDEIWHALIRLKEKREIPVIVSMGDYAASGGYFVALAGDKIFADPSTITGSIGVLGGKFALEDLWDKIGVSWVNVDISDTATSMSPNFKFTKKQIDIFNKSLDRVYKDFTLKVSEARKIDMNALDRLARGRVWTGAEAVEKHLVDEIGGLTAALVEAKKLTEIGEDDSFGLVFYPKQKTLQEKISELLQGGQPFAMDSTVRYLGIEAEKLFLLKRLKYDAVLPPMIFND